MDFDLNKDPHIDLKADISHSDELLRSIPLEVLEGAQSAQKESFVMRLQGMSWMLKKMLYFFTFLRWFILFAGISSNGGTFPHAENSSSCSVICVASEESTCFFLPDSDTGHDRTVSNAYLQ